MKAIRKSIFASMFLPVFSWAAMPVLSYKSVDCRLFVEDKIAKEQTAPLMTLVIEERLGRFAQIQFGDEQTKIQYQILLEDDLQAKNLDTVLILQNLMVDKLESSSEISAKEINWVRIAQGTYSVSCDLKHE